MNKKDYKEIAGIINKHLIDAVIDVQSDKVVLVDRLADYFEKEEFKKGYISNTRFNREQFLKDCGVE